MLWLSSALVFFSFSVFFFSPRFVSFFFFLSFSPLLLMIHLIGYLFFFFFFLSLSPLPLPSFNNTEI